MNFSLQDRPCSNQMADSWLPTAVISHFYSAVYDRINDIVCGVVNQTILMKRAGTL